MHRVGTPIEHGGERAAEVERVGDGIRLHITLHAGETTGMMLETGEVTSRQISRDEMIDMFLQTRDFWRRWLDRSTYTGRWREMVTRSAMTLKLMTYAPTGALVAAPTAALPEQVGGERNWDYRYTWVRDASFSVHALLSLGYTEEAEAFVGWLMHRILESAGEASRPAQDHVPGRRLVRSGRGDARSLRGYPGSSPVRIGNGAADQLQLDIYGEAMDSIHLADKHGLQLLDIGWTQVRNMLDWVCDNWDQPDEGIWETRGGRQPFTYGASLLGRARSRAAGWPVARAAGLGEQMDAGARPESTSRSCRTGGIRGPKAFVQHYGSDASMPAAADAADGLSSLPAIRVDLHALGDGQELTPDSLVYRYNPSASPRWAPWVGGHVLALLVLLR